MVKTLSSLFVPPAKSGGMEINMREIDRIFIMIDSNQPENVQREGRILASEIEYLSVFFQPVENKGVWENCAKIICEKTDDILQGKYLFQMFEWLKDLTWPGASLVYQRICKMNCRDYYLPFKIVLKEALMTDDQTWIYNLSLFIEETDILKYLPQEYGDILTAAYND